MTSDRIESFTNDSLTFPVIDSGPLDGIPIILLHGFPLRASSWAKVAERLHELGYRTYAPDQRGYVAGARPRGRLPYRVSKLAGDVIALMDAIGEGPIHVVGHDWGATVAWTLAAQHPERVRSLTTLSVPHSGAFGGSMIRSNQAVRSYYMAVFQVPFLPEWAVSRNPATMIKEFRKSGMTDEMIEDFRTDILDGGALTGALNWYRALWIFPPWAARKKVTVPTTHVWSSGDDALSRVGAELVARFVSGPYEFRVLEGVSHWIPEEAPAEVAEIVNARARSAG